MHACMHACMYVCVCIHTHIRGMVDFFIAGLVIIIPGCWGFIGFGFQGLEFSSFGVLVKGGNRCQQNIGPLS